MKREILISLITMKHQCVKYYVHLSTVDVHCTCTESHYACIIRHNHMRITLMLQIKHCPIPSSNAQHVKNLRHQKDAAQTSILVIFFNREWLHVHTCMYCTCMYMYSTYMYCTCMYMYSTYMYSTYMYSTYMYIHVCTVHVSLQWWDRLNTDWLQ